MDLNGFNSVFEIFAGISSILTGMPFIRYALLITLKSSFIEHEKTDAEIQNDINYIAGVFNKRKKKGLGIYKFRYKFLVPKPRLKNRPSFAKSKDLIDKVSQGASFYVLLYCITILIFNGYCSFGKPLALPFSSFVFDQSIIIQPKELIKVYVYVSMILVLYISLSMRNKENHFFHRGEKGVLFITIKGLARILTIHFLSYVLSLVLYFNWLKEIKPYVIHPRLTAIVICFMPIFISYCIYIYGKSKLRIWNYKVTRHSCFRKSIEAFLKNKS